MFKEIKYFLTISVLVLPLFIVSLFAQLRLLGLVECIFVYFFYMGLDTRDLVDEYQFEVRLENEGDSNELK
ncbi:TPA: hypothetical protein TZM76_000922 [Streptococcus suis]|uniref:TMhelix containing protein n=1 Tax=Streptococcus suis TaxID=1307 RepID=A0AAW9DF92_STRSU|nr:hypothetical protein [Streptococcus suis]MBM0272525.1 hypothetical protein [Streptococcus suis]MBM7203786.1 hypothetical protein [Streptococcus suis]MBM7282909.1 hypothetical protein [Streptococcus suis]MBO4135337.1 hypothetical protein [Streptococcus suis]MDW8711190.1 hypothetical protein [Streptococcus suis]